MLQHTGISWAQATMNSLYGCNPYSLGCHNCYAKRYLPRFAANSKQNRDGCFDDLIKISKVRGRQVVSLTGNILFNPAHLYAALADHTPKMIFVNAFSDILHEALPFDLIMEHFRVFAHAPQHVFQLLTKRDDRLAEVNSAVLKMCGMWPRNVWMGVSVCTAADREFLRIRRLAETAAALRWISFEPWQSDPYLPLRAARPALRELLRENNINWVVVGGESGGRNDTALMTLDDARYLVEEGRAAGSRVFFKQLGTALAIRLDVYSTSGKGEHRSQGGNPDQWPEDLCIQEFPEALRAMLPLVSDFRPAFERKTCLHFGRGADGASRPGQLCAGALETTDVSDVTVQPSEAEHLLG